ITDFRAGNFSGLTAQNTTVKHVFRRGIQVSTNGTGNTIAGNTVDDVTGAGGALGIAVFGGDTLISGNTVTNSTGGIGANANFGPTQFPLLTVKSNQLTGNAVGLNLAALAGGSVIGGPSAADGNTIDSSAGGTADVGALVTFAPGTVTVRH